MGYQESVRLLGFGAVCGVVLGVPVSRRFGYPGNERCWGDGYDFFYCCELSPATRESCWKGGWTFNACCFSEITWVVGFPGNVSCWDPGPAKQLSFHRCCDRSVASPPTGHCWHGGRSFETCCYRDPYVQEHIRLPLDRAVQHPGKPDCWTKEFDFDICCNEQLRAQDSMHFCWDDVHTFESCCFRLLSDSDPQRGSFIAGLAHGASSNAKGIEEFLEVAHSILPDGRPASDIVAGAFVASKGWTYHVPLGIYLAPLRDLPVKVLEIGLGCGTGQSPSREPGDDFWKDYDTKAAEGGGFPPGGSMQIWQKWFRHPDVQLWSAELEPKCVANAMSAGLKFNLLMGDQSDPETLRHWIQTAGGHFDVVIDDAAHSNAATRTAFQALWPHVQPGGIYIIEDLVWSRNPRVQGAKNKEVMPFVDTIKEWIDQLLIDPAQTFSGSSDGRFEESRLGSSQAEVIEKRFPELLSKDNVYRVQDPLPGPASIVSISVGFQGKTAAGSMSLLSGAGVPRLLRLSACLQGLLIELTGWGLAELQASQSALSLVSQMSHAASTADASKVCPVSIIAVFVPKQTAVQAMANWTRCCCVASFALLLLWARFADAAPVTPCLPHAIPESARKNVVVDGESMPLGIWTSSFDSATIVSKIYEIIAQERLGFNTIMDFGNTSRTQVFKLAGCDHDSVEMTNVRNCGPPRRFHISMEFWYAASPWWSSWAREIGEHAPVNLGSIGYQGKEGLYVMETALQKALEGRGLALEYYRSYNASWFYPARYASVVSDVDLNKLQACADSVEGYFPDLGTVYFASTGDADGVEQVNGTTRLKCWQQKWWPAPACRHNVPGCVAVVSGGAGWGWPEMIQQAFFHNMPLAFATAQHGPENYYVSLNRQLQSLLYWWMPDTTFKLENPSRVIFPPNSPAEYAKQIFKTQQDNINLTKWAVGMEASADRAVALARNLFITDDEISQILAQHARITSCMSGNVIEKPRFPDEFSVPLGDSIDIPCEPRKSEAQADSMQPEEASQQSQVAGFSESRMASASTDTDPPLGNATEPVFFFYSWPYMLQQPLLTRCGSDAVDLRRLCATNISEEYCVLVHRRPGYAKEQKQNVVPALAGCSCANAALEAEQGDISWNFQQLSHVTFLRLQLAKHSFLHWSGPGNEVLQYRDVVFGTPHSAMGFIGHPSLLELLRRWAYYEEASLANAEKGESFECSGQADCQVKRFLTVLEWLMVARLLGPTVKLHIL
ncbi:elmMI, partial [Symbiodinium sp. KB8]